MLKTTHSNMAKSKLSNSTFGWLAFKEGGVKRKSPKPYKSKGNGKFGSSKFDPNSKGKGDIYYEITQS